MPFETETATGAPPIPISEETCVIRDTARRNGRTLAVEPGPTCMRYLHYGRILVEAGGEPVEFSTAERETGLICLKGKAVVRTAGERFELAPYDALYVPPGSQVVVDPACGGCDLAEVGAPVDGTYPVQFVSFEEIRRDGALHFTAGQEPAERDLNILIGSNVEAGRILAGVTFSKPGNWTSWPPHEHAAALEEAYVYIDMPPGSWGVQLLYTKTDAPELVVFVRENDCVLMPAGYHPNVACPAGRIGFLWMMAAHREGLDRRFGKVNVQREYAEGASGLEASRSPHDRGD